MPGHWTEKLFIEKPEYFKRTIEERFKKTDPEIEGLIKLFTEYGITKGGRILDLACGIGRVAVPLAQQDYNVVGLDISPDYIQHAKKYAQEKQVEHQTRFIEGDMRKVSTELKNQTASFDAVINIWTSMGYWDEETDENILRQSLALTRPSGVFIMHTVNKDNLLRRFQARDFSDEDDLVRLMDRKLDLETSRMINYWTYYYRESNGDLKLLEKMEINHRVYSLNELKKQFQDAGWSYKKSYGGFTLDPLTMDTFSMIIVAEKP